jgi:hypothetical protein
MDYQRKPGVLSIADVELLHTSQWHTRAPAMMLSLLGLRMVLPVTLRGGGASCLLGWQVDVLPVR